jgi:predicted Zn-ribbon and HTH transcriptional regulator
MLVAIHAVVKCLSHAASALLRAGTDRHNRFYRTLPQASMNDATDRERIAEAIREEPLTASQLSQRVRIPRSAVYEHLPHVAQSIEGTAPEEQFLVAPPECGNCGFSGFDEPINYPSRCPECRSENIQEPVFTIE